MDQATKTPSNADDVSSISRNEITVSRKHSDYYGSLVYGTFCFL